MLKSLNFLTAVYEKIAQLKLLSVLIPAAYTFFYVRVVDLGQVCTALAEKVSLLPRFRWCTLPFGTEKRKGRRQSWRAEMFAKLDLSGLLLGK